MKNKVKCIEKVNRFRIYCNKCDSYMHKLTEITDKNYKTHIYECMVCNDQLEIINLKSNEL